MKEGAREAGKMRIEVKYYAQCRDYAGRESEEVELERDRTVKGAVEMVKQRYPRMKELVGRSLIAVNEEYAPLERELQEGDVLVFIPPVSGGTHSSR